ncbi:cytochrome P450 [Aspergillus luchuensis]|uniref:Cytochrome P450 n=1 Tax=Aspergillus kawachii TaxID=1069201 RepID=A0A146FU15_ASPKA|nr:cytochrome P450 [Aspergillus luchuensis]
MARWCCFHGVVPVQKVVVLRPTRQAWTGTKKKEDSPYNGSGRKYRTYALVVFLHPRQNFGWENGRTSDPNRQLDGPKVPAVVEYRPKIVLRKKPDNGSWDDSHGGEIMKWLQ